MTSLSNKPRLIHESLHHISQSIRFLINGLIGQIVFMVGYNLSASTFEPRGYSASTIYAVFYLLYIPVGHALQSLLVFGWPKDYLPSLMSNVPIGLSAMAIGTMLTGFLSKMGFHSIAEEWISSTLGIDPRDDDEKEGGGGELYSSVVVMIITGIWGYILSLYVNAAPPSGEKKRKTVEKDPAKEL